MTIKMAKNIKMDDSYMLAKVWNNWNSYMLLIEKIG